MSGQESFFHVRYSEDVHTEIMEVDAEFFSHSSYMIKVYEFLEKHGIQAEVDKVKLSRPGRELPSRGMSDRLRIRTIHGRNSRTVTKALPCWVAVSGLQWVSLYRPDEFERSFRRCD